MRKPALILFALIPVLGICQINNPANKKMEDPFAISGNITPGFTKITPYPSIFGYDLGADFGYFFKDNLWVSAGFNYSHKAFKQDPLSINAKTNPKNVTGILDYYEFPISGHYRTGDFSKVTHEEKRHKGHQAKLGFSGSAGITPGFLWDGKYDYPSSTAGTDHQIDPAALKNAGYKSIVSVFASAGLYYHVTHHFFMTVEPEIKYSFSQVPNTSKYHWSTFGFKVTLWYRILPQPGV
jgi:hypothetical protein